MKRVMKDSKHSKKQVSRGLFIISCLFALLLTGCSAKFAKLEAQDHTALTKRLPTKGLLQEMKDGEQAISPGPDWLAGINPRKNLIFLGVTGEPDHVFGTLLNIDLKANILHYAPLSPEDTPLTVLADREQRMALKELTMSWSEEAESLAGTSVRTIPLDNLNKKLTSPIPRPGRIYAVAANYPSHLFVDLSLPDKKELITHLQKARPRIFQKYPPVAAPGDSAADGETYAELPGPFGTLAAPEQVQVPLLDGQSQKVSGHLDYEVEIAAVIGRDLSWNEVQNMDDQELQRTVTGYLLASDSKVRDPQVMGNIVRTYRGEKVPPNNSYRVGYNALDVGLGIWDETTCHWWSYAASWGHYASLGPFLVTATDQNQLPPRMILSARSYTSASDRPMSPPKGAPTDRFLLRQATLTTTAPDYPDALIWGIPKIIRSLLDPSENALAFANEVPTLRAGDLIALGTPGGTVISAKPWWLLSVAKHLLFWKGPDDFYDLFFDPTEGYYLNRGDQLFLWAEGLGYQQLRIGTPGTSNLQKR